MVTRARSVTCAAAARAPIHGRGNRARLATFSSRRRRPAARNASSSSRLAETRRADDEEAGASAKESSAGDYDWKRQWYPVGTLSSFEKRASLREPIEVTLLGESLVVWAEPGKTQTVWSCSKNLCPHRLAPMSEGRVRDDGRIECSYHGWQFEKESGVCTRIPQASPEEEAKFCSSSRCTLSMHPIQVKYGLVWVWPDNSKAGLAESMDKPPVWLEPLEAIDDDDIETLSNEYYQRDLEYDFDTLVENIVDSSHVPHAHSGIQGHRDRPFPYGLDVVRFDRDAGVRATVAPKDRSEPVPEAMRESYVEFLPPVAIRYRFSSAFFSGAKTKPSKRSANLVVLATPTAPGKCRIFFRTTVMHAESLPFMLKLISRLRPVFLEHQTRMDVFDSDAWLLAKQETQGLEYGTKRNWRELFVTPTRADDLVLGFRRWVDEWGAGGPFGGMGGEYLVNREMSKRQALDRYEQHTRHCVHCSAALRNFQLLKKVSVAVGALSAVAASFIGPLWALAGLAIAFLTYTVSERFERRLVFTDYIHAHVP